MITSNCNSTSTIISALAWAINNKKNYKKFSTINKHY